MTHHDKARELVERLRQQKTTDEMERYEVINADFEGAYDFLVRDCREAADLIAALAEENRRLREALQRIEAASKFWSEYPDGNDAIRYAHDSTHRLARAALSSTGGGRGDG